MPEITSYPQGASSWTELSTTDEAGALKFYSALLGWEDDPQPMGPDMGFYHMQRLNGLGLPLFTNRARRRRPRAFHLTGGPTSRSRIPTRQWSGPRLPVAP